jgi:hypothetical protein
MPQPPQAPCGASCAIALHTLGNEQRILDTDLAEALGMATPRAIRFNLIEPNRAELESLGNLHEFNANAGQRGRPATAYYLNEEQALLVCMFSRTANAQAVRRQVIDTFMAVRRGQLQPTIPNFNDPVTSREQRSPIMNAAAADVAAPRARHSSRSAASGSASRTPSPMMASDPEPKLFLSPSMAKVFIAHGYRPEQIVIVRPIPVKAPKRR